MKFSVPTIINRTNVSVLENNVVPSQGKCKRPGWQIGIKHIWLEFLLDKLLQHIVYICPVHENSLEPLLHYSGHCGLKATIRPGSGLFKALIVNLILVVASTQLPE
ncbi:hypothetical protein Y032_0034g2936 [Ancylostoma ceylanicum]|uniref:Uncharacterized protein n=1 Tax=Ancylostoma ceylanicum TaxID=53326 RepID=A0A016UPC1_9BILA|nr:hypothetical protein Y032_0034g2936 [Ancylostoma ceylanicum]